MQGRKLIAAALRRKLVQLAPAGDGGMTLPPLQTKDGRFEPAKAVDWHRKRDRALTKEEWTAQSVAFRQRSFTVANIAQLDVIHDVWKAIDKAIADGTTLEDFKRDVGPSLKKAWAGTVKNPAARIETIFRTNVQVAYGAGRWHQAQAAVETHPFWQLDVVLDGRTSDTCKPVAGIVLPADHPWWRTNIPPRHFRCRATIRSLRARQAERLKKAREEQGLSNAPGDAKAQDGFGHEPTEDARRAAIEEFADKKLAGAPDPLRDAAGGKSPPNGMGGGGSGGDGGGRRPRSEWGGAAPGENDGEPPWHMDAEERPHGTINEKKPRRKLDAKARRTAQYLAAQGNDVDALPKLDLDSVPDPDASVNASKTTARTSVVEFTALGSPKTATTKTLLNKIQEKDDDRQAENSIFDVRGSAITRDDALEAFERAKGAGLPNLRFIRIIGDGFDLTFWNPA